METWTLELLQPFLLMQHPPEGEGYFSVREEGLKELARAQGRPLREAMITCLKEGIWPERFRPNRGAFTMDDQVRLLQSTVAVIGLGGLGGAVSLILARLGVGRLILVDGDDFEESNLNRQMLATLDTLGRGKAETAAIAVSRVNPVVEVRPHPVWAYEDNLPRLLEGAQVAVDCLDNLAARYLLQEAASKGGIPLIHGSVAGLEGMVMVIRPGEPGLMGLYGPTPAAKVHSAESFLGVPTMTPAMIAGLQANEAVKLILGRPGLGPGQVLHLDLGAPALERLAVG